MEFLSFESMFHPQKYAGLKTRGFLLDIDSVAEYEKSFSQRKSTMPNPGYWKGKRVLVTGSAGMVGSTIADFLIEMGAEVYGTVKRHAVAYFPNIQKKIDEGKLHPKEVDLRDYARIARLLKDIEPHVIIHQAAESFVPTSVEQPSYVTENNCLSTVNLLEAAHQHEKSIERIQLACSSEQYGLVKKIEEVPVKETNELRPTSPYAATKVFTENIAKAYHYMYNTPVIINRTFNQEGPRRGRQFFTSSIAMQIARITQGKQDRLIMGNPNSVRDFTHIHDSAKGQIIAVEKCDIGEVYNICSGKGILCGDYAKLALKAFGLDKKVKIEIDKARLRPYERDETLFDGFIGDNSKVREKTGWQPTKSMVDIIRDGVEHHRLSKE